MNPEQNHKTVAYIILGIVVVIALAVYIYIVLSANPAVKESPPAVTTSGRAGLTPEQAAAKQALIASQLAEQKPQPLTTAQASAKAALIKSQLKTN